MSKRADDCHFSIFAMGPISITVILRIRDSRWTHRAGTHLHSWFSHEQCEISMLCPQDLRFSFITREILILTSIICRYNYKFYEFLEILRKSCCLYLTRFRPMNH